MVEFQYTQNAKKNLGNNAHLNGTINSNTTRTVGTRTIDKSDNTKQTAVAINNSADVHYTDIQYDQVAEIPNDALSAESANTLLSSGNCCMFSGYGETTPCWCRFSFKQ